MTVYAIEIKKSAQKSLGRLPEKVKAPIDSAINALAQEPRPPGTSKIMGERNTFRIRVGDYRIVYEVDDGARSVKVRAIGNRSIVYRGYSLVW